MCLKKLNRDFFNRDTLIVARELLGKYIVREYDNNIIMGIITETEAYCGVRDKACHTYGGRRTERTETMFGEPGYAYVYLTYGMHFCLNAVTEEIGNPCAVLIRGIKILDGVDIASENRYNKLYKELSKYQTKNLSNGPGKVCKALKIDKSLNKEDLLGHRLYTCDNNNLMPFDIREDKRVGIDYAEEYKDMPWRFILYNK